MTREDILVNTKKDITEIAEYCSKYISESKSIEELSARLETIIDILEYRKTAIDRIEAVLCILDIPYDN